MKTICSLALVFMAVVGFAQPSTEVYLFDLKMDGSNIVVTNPRNISNNEGYDNQPHFMPDGESLLFTSNHDGQTDIIRYYIEAERKERLTNTPGSEYSPTPTPDGRHFSSILLEQDGTQLLWQYSLSSGKASILVKDLKIGYHAWVDENQILSFVLGDPNTMQLNAVVKTQNKIVAQNIGRSLHRIPASNLMSFIHKENENEWFVKTYDSESGEIKKLLHTLSGSEDMAWIDGKTILMGNDGKLYKWQHGIDKNWVLVKDFAEFELQGISRIASSPTGDKIAVVVNQ